MNKVLRGIRKLGTREGMRTAAKVISRTRRRGLERARRSPAGQLYRQVVAALRRSRLGRDVAHLSGPGPTPCGPDDVTVVCLVRDGAYYLPSFVKHYTALGVRQIVLLDNGSIDGTAELARGYANVTVLRSALPFRSYQMLFREYLVAHYGLGGWRLLVDIDELFDYPRSDLLPLKGLLAYLNAGGYSAMVAYMLDMFAQGSLSRAAAPENALRSSYAHYDLGNLRVREYAEHYGEGNRVSNPAIKLYWGGIRNTLFGSEDWLSKHPLFFPERGVRMAGHVAHDVSGAHVADITGVLYHYKLIEGFVERVNRAVDEENYWGGSYQYKRYKAVLDAAPDLQIMSETAQQLTDVDALVDQGLLVVSPAYDAWVARGRAGELVAAAHESELS